MKQFNKVQLENLNSLADSHWLDYAIFQEERKEDEKDYWNAVGDAMVDSGKDYRYR